MKIQAKLFFTVEDILDLIDKYNNSESSKIPLPTKDAKMEIVTADGVQYLTFDASDEGPL